MPRRRPLKRAKAKIAACELDLLICQPDVFAVRCARCGQALPDIERVKPGHPRHPARATKRLIDNLFDRGIGSTYTIATTGTAGGGRAGRKGIGGRMR